MRLATVGTGTATTVAVHGEGVLIRIVGPGACRATCRRDG